MSLATTTPTATTPPTFGPENPPSSDDLVGLGYTEEFATAMAAFYQQLNRLGSDGTEPRLIAFLSRFNYFDFFQCSIEQLTGLTQKLNAIESRAELLVTPDPAIEDPMDLSDLITQIDVRMSVLGLTPGSLVHRLLEAVCGGGRDRLPVAGLRKMHFILTNSEVLF